MRCMFGWKQPDCGLTELSWFECRHVFICRRRRRKRRTARHKLSDKPQDFQVSFIILHIPVQGSTKIQVLAQPSGNLHFSFPSLTLLSISIYNTSEFCAIWLVPQSQDIKYYSPPGGFRVKKMSRETHFIRKWSNFLGIAIKLVLYILKQLFASVSVTSGGYLPCRSGSVNIHCYSPPLLRIIVN